MSLSFFAAAREAPARTAVVTEAAAYTFETFLPFVRGAIAELAALGLRPGDGRRVALTASIRLGTLARLYALMEMGIAFVPLHDRLTERERAEIIRTCDPAIVLDERPPLAPGAPPSPEPTGPFPDDERPLAILHTSGTSGAPKGVVLCRRAFVASAEASAANLGWREDDRWALSLPLAHVGGISIVTRTLLARRAIVLAGPFDAAGLARLVGALRVTLLSAVPAMVRALLDLEPSWSPPDHLRAVLTGGGPIPAPLLEEAWARGLPLLPSYGLTETCSQIAAWPYGTRPPAPVAKPLPGVEIRTDGERIRVRGPMLFTSYFPCGDGPGPFLRGGWFDTGDRGAIGDDGFLRVFGRTDETIVTGGENVSPREIEEVMERFPGIRAACVFGVQDETWGEIVAAALVLEKGEDLDPAALAVHLARVLAPHKRPRRVAVLASLPAGSAGKTDRAAVARAAAPLLKTIRT